MTRPLESEDRTLADRLVNYSDAVVALAFLVSSGLGLAVAEPDTRGSFAEVTGGMILGYVVLGVIFSALLIILRRWELDLRIGSHATGKFRRYSRYLYLARHTVVWLTVVQTIIIMKLI